MDSNQEITLTWSKLQLMMVAMKHFDKMSNPIAMFKWSNIGLKRIAKKEINYKWHFEVIDKNKLTFAVIKYNLEL